MVYSKGWASGGGALRFVRKKRFAVGRRARECDKQATRVARRGVSRLFWACEIAYGLDCMSNKANLGAAFTETTALSRPLCVDLDGTLITTDTLWEGVILLFRQRPWIVLAVPFWLLGGRARIQEGSRRAREARSRHAPLPVPAARGAADQPGGRPIAGAGHRRRSEDGRCRRRAPRVLRCCSRQRRWGQPQSYRTSATSCARRMAKGGSTT